MKMLRSKRSAIWVTMIFILMGLACIAYSSWSWAGASAWCAQYPDGWGTASGSVGWGGVIGGNWSTYASLSGFSDTDSGFCENAGGGGSSYLSGGAATGAAGASISALGGDGQNHSASDSDSF